MSGLVLKLMSHMHADRSLREPVVPESAFNSEVQGANQFRKH